MSLPKERGGGSGKGALVTGQSQEASLKPPMITHPRVGRLLSSGTRLPPSLPPLPALRAHLVTKGQ